VHLLLNAAKRGKGTENFRRLTQMPKKLDEEVVSLHLEMIGVVLTKLTKAQAEYLGVPVEDSYKPEHYRY